MFEFLGETNSFQAVKRFYEEICQLSTMRIVMDCPICQLDNVYSEGENT